jgi:hypothetical protein
LSWLERKIQGQPPTDESQTIFLLQLVDFCETQVLVFCISRAEISHVLVNAKMICKLVGKYHPETQHSKRVDVRPFRLVAQIPVGPFSDLGRAPRCCTSHRELILGAQVCPRIPKICNLGRDDSVSDKIHKNILGLDVSVDDLCQSA